MPSPDQPTPIIDAQVHAYERDHPGRPWVGTLHGPSAVTGADMVAAMDAVAVDGALLVSPWTMYRYDASYALEVYAHYPKRFGLIKPIDPAANDVAEQVAAWAATPGAVGARIVLLEKDAPDAAHAGINALLSAAAEHELPINMLCWGRLELFAELARRHPHTQLVLDHVGLTQHFEPPPPADPFRDLGKVLALAAFDNVAIKITGACTLSQESFPYADIRAPLEKIFHAFGFARCLWGTDWTRATAFVSYAEGVDAFRLNAQLSASERAALMGGTLARIYRWTPGTA